jgi:hypothetical protein
VVFVALHMRKYIARVLNDMVSCNAVHDSLPWLALLRLRRETIAANPRRYVKMLLVLLAVLLVVECGGGMAVFGGAAAGGGGAG